MFKRALTSTSVLILLTLLGIHRLQTLVRAEAPEGFTPLFNGTDLSGWKGLVGNPKSRAAMSEAELAAAQKKADELMRAHWKVVDGVLVLSGADPLTGQVYPTSLTAEITKDRDGEKVWKKGGERVTISRGRINWFGRDPDWVDKIGFRGKNDVESPRGEWTRMEVIADGGHLVYKVNGTKVNEAFEAKPDFGKLLLQTEQAEMFVRRYELWPIGKAPTDKLKQ